MAPLEDITAGLAGVAQRHAPLPVLAPVYDENDAEAWDQAERRIPEIPLYRRLYGGDVVRHFSVAARLPSLPVLHRSQLVGAFPREWMTRELRNAMLADEVELATTSGSSGERVHIARPKDWWKIEHRRTFKQVGLLREFTVGRSPKAVLTTLDCSANRCFAGRTDAEDRVIDKTLYLNVHDNPNDWRRPDVERMVSEIDDHRPDLLDADPVFLALFIEKCRRWNVSLPVNVPVVSLDYERVSAFQLREFRAVFDAPIVNLHGTTELGCLLVAEFDGFRSVTGQLLIEMVPFEPARGTYELVVTSVKNPFMPLVRYAVGDVVWAPDYKAGPLNATSVIADVCGRACDAVPTASGRITGGEIDRVLARCDVPILLYQVEIRGQVLVFHYVTREERPLSHGEAADIMQALVDGTGMRCVELSHETEIQPERSGKFATLKSVSP